MKNEICGVRCSFPHYSLFISEAASIFIIHSNLFVVRSEKGLEVGISSCKIVVGSVALEDAVAKEADAVRGAQRGQAVRDEDHGAAGERGK